MKKRSECLISSCTVYLIQNCADLHKLFVQFSHLKSFIKSSLGFSTLCEHLHTFVPQVLYNIRVRVVSDIRPLASGSNLYIRYNTAANIVNSILIIWHRVLPVKLRVMIGWNASRAGPLFSGNWPIQIIGFVSQNEICHLKQINTI